MKHSHQQTNQTKVIRKLPLKKLYKLTWNILYIKQKQLCCKDSVKTFFYFNLPNFTKNLQTTLINQRIFNMECTRIWGSSLVVNASNNAVISTTNIFSQILVVVWPLQTRTIVILNGALGFILCTNKVCKRVTSPLSLTQYFCLVYRINNFSLKQIVLPMIWNANISYTQNPNVLHKGIK